MTAPLPAPPQLSPDGRYWWDGERWTEVGSTGPAAPTPAAVATTVVPPLPAVAPKPWYATPIGELRRRSVRAQVVFAACIGVLVMVVVALVSAVSEEQRQAELEQQLDDRVCQEFGGELC